MNFEISAYDTGTLDTLNQELLAEEVHYDQRRDDHHTAGIVDCRVEQVGTCKAVVLEGRGNLEGQVRPQEDLTSGEEQRGIEVVSPLPGERKEEYRDHHRDRKRDDDLNKRAENT